MVAGSAGMAGRVVGMGTLAISAALGMAGALLCVLTWRVRLAVWVALMPLAAAAWLATPLTAAVAGLIFGAVACLPDVRRGGSGGWHCRRHA